MSKVDAMRALREAKYAAAAKASPRQPAPSPAARPSPAAGKARAATMTSPPGPASPVAPEPGRCGHRNMGGKSCTRDVGHSEKNHRYS